MSRIEEELGLVSEQSRKWLEDLWHKSYTGEDQHVQQLHKAAQIDISVSEIIFDLNEQELSISQIHKDVILLTRKLARHVIFDRWSTLTQPEAVQIDNLLAAHGIKSCLESYEEDRYISDIISPPEGYINYLKHDLQGASYGRAYLGIR